MAENAQQKQVRMRIQDNNARATYANAFRHNANANELILDLGINLVTPHPDAKGTADDPAADMLFQVDTRVVMNYATTKRLSGFLNQLIQAHEQKFGEIKTDA
ncbi:MAG: DUF3467 domain-containing protein [Planctomycetota bacterium]